MYILHEKLLSFASLCVSRICSYFNSHNQFDIQFNSSLPNSSAEWRGIPGTP